MRFLRNPVRVAVWLATPLVVWAGSFSGSWLGARLGASMTWLIGGGVVGGILAVVLWIFLIRHLRKRWTETTEVAEPGGA